MFHRPPSCPPICGFHCRVRGKKWNPSGSWKWSLWKRKAIIAKTSYFKISWLVVSWGCRKQQCSRAIDHPIFRQKRWHLTTWRFSTKNWEFGRFIDTAGDMLTWMHTMDIHDYWHVQSRNGVSRKSLSHVCANFSVEYCRVCYVDQWEYRMSESRKICHELLMTDRSERRKAGVKKRRWNVNTFFGVETGNNTVSKGLRSQQVACHSHGQMFGMGCAWRRLFVVAFSVNAYKDSADGRGGIWGQKTAT